MLVELDIIIAHLLSKQFFYYFFLRCGSWLSCQKWTQEFF